MEKPFKPNRVWLDADIVTCLAWLDICAATKRLNFKDTVVERIKYARKERGEEFYDFQYKQACNKLNDFAKGSNKEPSQSKIREKGTKYFTNISESMKRDIKAEKVHLQNFANQLLQESGDYSDILDEKVSEPASEGEPDQAETTVERVRSTSIRVNTC